MTVDRTLAAIDAALEPWECAEDAARWHADGDGPDELAKEEGMRGLSPTLVIYDEVNWEVASRSLAALGNALLRMPRGGSLGAAASAIRRGSRPGWPSTAGSTGDASSRGNVGGNRRQGEPGSVSLTRIQVRKP